MEVEGFNLDLHLHFNLDLDCLVGANWLVLAMLVVLTSFIITVQKDYYIIILGLDYLALVLGVLASFAKAMRKGYQSGYFIILVMDYCLNFNHLK